MTRRTCHCGTILNSFNASGVCGACRHREQLAALRSVGESDKQRAIRERREGILGIIERGGRPSLAALSARYEVSAPTVAEDLASLVRDGRIEFAGYDGRVKTYRVVRSDEEWGELMGAA